MPVSEEQFREKSLEIVREHYEQANRPPLLLAQLGARLKSADAWPADRRGRNLRQLLEEIVPELEIVRDSMSPAFVAVAPHDQSARVKRIIEERQRAKAGVARFPIGEIEWPVLLAFCVRTQQDAPVYLRIRRPFRYRLEPPSPEDANDYAIVEPEFRRPGLRVDRVEEMSPSDRDDLSDKVQRWTAQHGVDLRQISRWQGREKDEAVTAASALDRLLAAQRPEIASQLVLPADLAQLLARIR